MNAVILQTLAEIEEIAGSKKPSFNPYATDETVNEEYTASSSVASYVYSGGENEIQSQEEPLLQYHTIDHHVKACDDVAEKSGMSKTSSLVGHVGQRSVEKTVVRASVISYGNTAPTSAAGKSNAAYPQYNPSLSSTSTASPTVAAAGNVDKRSVNKMTESVASSSSSKAPAPATAESNAVPPDIHARFSNYLIESQYSYSMLASREGVQNQRLL